MIYAIFAAMLLMFNATGHAADFALEHANTPEALTWGLMKRPSLPANQGLLLHYPSPRYITIWMFNMNFDLSVAFIDEAGIIREIAELKAYPEKMDPARPVNSVQDLYQYPPHDPIAQFFQIHSATSHTLTKYALEMNAGWFRRNHITIGDKIVWDGKGAKITRD